MATIIQTKKLGLELWVVVCRGVLVGSYLSENCARSVAYKINQNFTKVL